MTTTTTKIPSIITTPKKTYLKMIIGTKSKLSKSIVIVKASRSKLIVIETKIEQKYN